MWAERQAILAKDSVRKREAKVKVHLYSSFCEDVFNDGRYIVHTDILDVPRPVARITARELSCRKKMSQCRNDFRKRFEDGSHGDEAS